MTTQEQIFEKMPNSFGMEDFNLEYKSLANTKNEFLSRSWRENNLRYVRERSKRISYYIYAKRGSAEFAKNSFQKNQLNFDKTQIIENKSQINEKTAIDFLKKNGYKVMKQKTEWIEI